MQCNHALLTSNELALSVCGNCKLVLLPVLPFPSCFAGLPLTTYHDILDTLALNVCQANVSMRCPLYAQYFVLVHYRVLSHCISECVFDVLCFTPSTLIGLPHCSFEHVFLQVAFGHLLCCVKRGVMLSLVIS